jgi:hypothetical protein
MNTDATLTAALAAALADRIDLDALAARIAEHLRQQTPGPSIHPDTPIEVATIRAQLGRRGRPMAHTTFHRQFISTGLLTTIPGPNRAKTYVRAGDWQRVAKQIKNN